jgi:hypothetical protein
MKLFLKLDGDKVLGLFDGSSDYVHRVTGEPIENAKPVPDGAIPISDADLDTYRNSFPPSLLRWDGTQLISRAPETREEKELCVYMSRENDVISAEKVRISELSDSELDAIIGAI